MTKKVRDSLSTKKLSNRILAGLALGIATGLFIGEYASVFELVGDGFIGLLQMTVLPYIMLSLMVNIGRLKLGEGRKLIKIGLSILAILLAFGFVIVLIFPLAFPEWQSGSFFSESLVSKPPPIDFISIYIPSNPFQSMADNMVPAVVLFSIFIGIALMKIPNNEGLINNLDVMAKAFNQVNKIIIKITPIGVFAIAAHTAGTMTTDEIGKLQAYIYVYTAIVLILSLWVIPQFISATTPITYKGYFKALRGSLLTIFATGKIIVILPQLMDDIKMLLDKNGDLYKETETEVNLLMPLAYPFPNIGTLAILIFVLFAGWYIGSPLEISDYPLFVAAGSLSSFINPVTGIPFMLSLLDIPSDLVNLFLVSSIYTDRIRVVLGASHLIILTIMTIYYANGKWKPNVAKLSQLVLTTFVLLSVSIVGIRAILNVSLSDSYKLDVELLEMKSVYPHEPDSLILKESRIPTRLYRGQTKLARIKKRGVIRVAAFRLAAPYSFFNDQGEFKGYNIELARMLAQSLNVKLELMPIDSFDNGFDKDYYDLIIGAPLSSELASEYATTNNYAHYTMALLVKNENSDFKSFESLSKLDTFTVGYMLRPDFNRKFARYFPQAGFVRAAPSANFVEAFDTAHVDALLTSAETGSATTILHPEFKIYTPSPSKITVPMVCVIGQRDPEFRDYIHRFYSIMEDDGVFDNLYKHWVLGEDVLLEEKRWSVIKDVFHWVD